MRGKQGHKLRRRSALALFEEQSKRGTKPEKVDGKTTKKMIPLTEADKKRIATEIEVLMKRV